MPVCWSIISLFASQSITKPRGNKLCTILYIPAFLLLTISLLLLNITQSMSWCYNLGQWINLLDFLQLLAKCLICFEWWELFKNIFKDCILYSWLKRKGFTLLHTVTMYTLYFRFIQETEGAELGVISNNAWLLRYLVSRPLTSPPHYLLSIILAVACRSRDQLLRT